MNRLFSVLFAAGAVAAAAAPALAQDMRQIDRRLLVAVVGYALDERAASDALRGGANINLRDPAQRNDTLLILAIRNFSNPQVIRWILEHGGNPSIANDAGDTAVSVARRLSYDRLPGGREVLAMLSGRPAARGAAAEGRLMPEGGGVDPATGRGVAEPPRAAGAIGGPPPQPGVYECVNQGGVRTPMTFSILDGGTYMASNGRTGRYSYSAASGVLTMGGARFQRTGPSLFRPIRPDTGELGGFTCPLNRALDPRNPRRW